MIKVLFGEKGTGKTKLIINYANEISSGSKGDVVFIDDSNKLMYDLGHKVRFINVAEYPVKGQAGFLGFISGIVSQDYDIDTLIIDRVTHITGQGPEELKDFFTGIGALSENRNISFIITVTGSAADIPEFIKQYTVDAL